MDKDEGEPWPTGCRAIWTAAELFLMVAEEAKAEDIIVPTVGLADGIINELIEKI